MYSDIQAFERTPLIALKKWKSKSKYKRLVYFRYTESEVYNVSNERLSRDENSERLFRKLVAEHKGK